MSISKQLRNHETLPPDIDSADAVVEQPGLKKPVCAIIAMALHDGDWSIHPVFMIDEKPDGVLPSSIEASTERFTQLLYGSDTDATSTEVDAAEMSASSD